MPDFTIDRNERYQREYTVLLDGKPAIKGVRFNTEREAWLVVKALISAIEAKDFLESLDEKLDPKTPVKAPNTPDKHESVQAVKGQTPRT